MTNTRTLTAAVSAASTTATGSVCHLAKFRFSSGDLNLTSAGGAVTFNGESYASIGGPMTFAELRESPNFQRPNVQMTLNGVDTSVLSLMLNDQYLGRTVTIWRAYFNNNDTLIADPVLLGTYYMNEGFSYAESPDTATVSVSLSSRLIVGTFIRGIKSNVFSHQKYFPNDNFYKMVPTLVGKSVTWGKDINEPVHRAHAGFLSTLSNIASVALLATPLAPASLATRVGFKVGVAGLQYLSGIKKGDSTIYHSAARSAPSNPTSPDRSLPVVYGKMQIMPGTAYMKADEANTAPYNLRCVLDICHGPVSYIGKLVEASTRRIMSEENASAVTFSLTGPDETKRAAARLKGYTGWFTGSATPALGLAIISMSRHLGVATESLDTIPRDPTNNVWSGLGSGIAYVALRLASDKDGNPWGNGVQDFLVSVGGRLVYDPRSNTTSFNAGSGSNPALCLLDYLSSSIYGWGMASTEIDLNSFTESANHCDEVVTNPDGTSGPRYTCDGILDTSQPLINNTLDLLTACQGQLIQEAGLLRLYIPRSQSLSGLSITPANVIPGTFKVSTKGTSDYFNQLHAHYFRSESAPTSVFGWPTAPFYVPDEIVQPTGSDAINTFLTTDNNYPLIGTIQLPFTTNQYVAQRIAGTVLMRSRQRTEVECTCNEELLGARIGSIVTVTWAAGDGTDIFTNKQFEVQEWAIEEEQRINLKLLSYDAGDFTNLHFTSSAQSSSGLPNPFAVPVPQNVTIRSGVGLDRLVVNWTSTGSGNFERFEVFARKVTGSLMTQADATYSSIGHYPPDETTAYIGGVRNGDTWQAAVQARNSLGFLSDLSESANYVVTTYGFASASYAPAVASTGSVAFSASFDSNTSYILLYTNAGSSSADTSAPGETENFFAGTMVAAGTYDAAVLQTFTWLKGKMIAYNANGERGAESILYSLAVPQPIAGQTYTSSLSAPTALSASAESSTQIKISWTNPADGYTHTKTYRNGTLISTLAAGVASDTQAGLSSATTYSFDARHYSSTTADYSAYAGTIQQATQLAQLATPINVSAYAPAGGGALAHVSINWQYPDTPTAGASTIIQRADSSGGAYSTIATVGAGVTSYIHTDDSLRFATKFFKVKFSRDQYSDSALSAEVSSEYLRDGDSPQ